MKTFKEYRLDKKIDKSKNAWVRGDPIEPIDVSDNSGDMKSVLDKANRDVEKERGTKLKPFVVSYRKEKNENI